MPYIHLITGGLLAYVGFGRVDRALIRTVGAFWE